jgi:uncharacterized membrane protein
LSSGEFSGNFVGSHKSLTVIVKPKFWASPLGIFIIVAIVAMLLTAAFYIFLRSQKIREKRRLEEYRVKKEQEMMKEKMINRVALIVTLSFPAVIFLL